MSRILAILVLVAVLASVAYFAWPRDTKDLVMTPQPQASNDTGSNREVATLAGGCFWCLEAVFEQLKGVEKVESGYAGGTDPNPNYKQVCTGTTGHAEVVQVTFDPDVISFRELLEVFFVIHDPTTLDRQGADIGTQYR